MGISAETDDATAKRVVVANKRIVQVDGTK